MMLCVQTITVCVVVCHMAAICWADSAGAPAVPSITTDPPTSPFSAGVTVTLTCSSLDLGSPSATLTWVTWRQGVRTTPVNERTTRLEMFNLSVEDDGLSVKCQANNSVSHKETSFVLRVDQKASYGECRASVSSSTWQVTGYCDITQVFSSNNQYECNWYEVRGRDRNNIQSFFNRSLITPGRKLQKGKCGFQTKIPPDFLERREISRELKYQMFFNPGGTWSPINNVTIASPKAPTLTCPADVTEGSHMNCTCSTSDVGEPGGRLLLFSNDRLEDTGQYGQKVIFLSRDVRREDNNVRVSCRLHWARNMSADRDWILRVLYPPEMPSLLIGGRTAVNYTTNVHSSVHLTCRVGPSNVHRLELLKVTRNGSQKVQGLSTSFPSFRIQKAGCGDSGTYYCRAGNTLGQNNSTLVQLNVLCSPGLVNGSSARTQQLKVTEGSQGQVTFEVTGYPVPKIIGVSYHQGENMSKEEPVRADLFTVECEQNTPDVHLATCTLSIADATYTDNGMYNVHLSNSQGTIHVLVELIVDTQDTTQSTHSLSWIGLGLVPILILIGALVVFVIRRRAAQTKISDDKEMSSTGSRGGNAQNETTNGNEGERTSKKSDSSTSSPGQAAGNGSKSGGSTPRSSSSGSDKPSTNPNYTSTALQEVEIHPYMDLHTRDPTYASTTSSKDPHMYMELKTLRAESKSPQQGSGRNGNDGYETPRVPGQGNQSSDGYETPQPPREERRRSALYANQGRSAEPIQEEVNYYNEA